MTETNIFKGDTVIKFNVTEEQSVEFQRENLEIPPGPYLLAGNKASNSRIAHTLDMEHASVSIPTRGNPVQYSILDRPDEPIIQEQNSQIGATEKRFLKKLVLQLRK